MKLNPIVFSIAATYFSVISGLSGCASDVPDINPYDGYQLLEYGQDGADCLSSCPNSLDENRDTYRPYFEGSELSKQDMYFAGYFGYLDDLCHEGDGSEYDTDIISVRAVQGTPIRVDVTKASAKSGLAPLVTLYDSDGRVLLQRESNALVSLSFITPTTPFYIRIEDKENSNRYEFRKTPDAEACRNGHTYRGGETYGYSVNVRNEKVNSRNFGELVGAKSYASTQPVRAGEAAYYKVKNADGGAVRIKFVMTGNKSAAPLVTQIDRRDGDYRWISTNDYVNPAKTDKKTFDLLPQYADEDGYLWFVLSDYYGVSDFTYAITATPL